jgi:hypothetical protein
MNPNLTPFDHADIKSALDGLDYVAHQAELRWGIGRLRLLVADDLRAKFDRQAEMLDLFLWSDTATCPEIIGKIAAMRRAWAALDAVATAAGAAPRPPEYLECPLPAGGVASILADDADAAIVRDQAEGRHVAVYTVSEIGRMIAMAADVLTVKAVFPGAEVTAIRPRRQAKLDDSAVF